MKCELGLSGDEDAADLGRDRVLVARPRREGRAEALFGEAGPVERGGVEVADAELPGAGDRRLGRVRRNGIEEPGERSGAEPELRSDGEGGHMMVVRYCWACVDFVRP